MLSVEQHYSVEPIGDVVLTKEERARILGGEATMWSELVTPLTIDSRIWPRTAAIAERFWSAKEIIDVDNMKHRLKEVSFRLEELGVMHIRNRDVILRGMTNNQEINSLITLSKICEPLKVYSRNKGGTEYQTYSPFTLFADACVAEAEDAVSFNETVAGFINKADNNRKASLISFLEKWSKNHEGLLKISNNPNVKPLEGFSGNLSKVSILLMSVINNEKITNQEFEAFSGYINSLKEPVVDVELVIVDSLNDLISFCKANYLVQ